MPPVTDLGIVVSQSGGESAASALQAVNNKLADTGRTAATMAEQTSAGQDKITHALERGGLRVLALQAGHTVTALTGMTGAGRTTHLVLQAMLGAIGPGALAVGALAGGVMLLKAAWEKHNRDAEKAQVAFEKNYKAAKDLASAFEDAANKGEKLSAAAQSFVESFRVWKALGPEEPEVKKAAANYDEAATKLSTFKEAHKGAIAVMGDSNAVVTKGQESFYRLRRELAELQMQADKSFAELKKARGEIAATGVIVDKNAEKTKRWRELEAEYVDDVVKRAKAEQKEMDKTAAHAAEAAKKTHDEWMQKTAGIQGAFENLGVSMAEAVRTGTGSARDLFKSFADSVIQELERMAVKAAVANIFTQMGPGGAKAASGGKDPFAGVQAIAGLAPGGGLISMATSMFGLFAQHGGEVPGPIGQPVPIMAHGGERVTRTSARTDRGGGDTYNLNFRGGIGGLNAPDQRMIGRQMRSLIRMSGDLALA